MTSARDSYELMRRCGTSFALAARLLPAQQRARVARLYAACRTIDDLADQAAQSDGRARLERIRTGLNTQRETDPLVRTFLELAADTNLSLGAACDLVDGVFSDLRPVRMANEAELVRYAYKVAGTVGLMMSDVLGADTPLARAHAVDLGIGMQLTNIARDVLEDARQDRRYLPSTLAPFEPTEIARPSSRVEAGTRAAIRDTLKLSEHFYTSGLAGLVYLPYRAHLTVAVAAHLYREIGHVLRRRDGDYLRGRVVVPTPQRLIVATQAAIRCNLFSRRSEGHNPRLHADLSDLLARAGVHYATS